MTKTASVVEYSLKMFHLIQVPLESNKSVESRVPHPELSEIALGSSHFSDFETNAISWHTICAPEYTRPEH